MTTSKATQIIAESAVFALKGTLCDVINQGGVGNFSRSSAMFLEQYYEGSLQLYAVEAFKPAFSRDRSDFRLEPSMTNILTHNIDPSKNVWIKGSRVQVYPNMVELPNGDYTGCRVQFSAGNGNGNLIKRTLTLESGQQYTFSGILRAVDSLFGPSDYIRLTGGVVGTVEIKLADLNATPNRYVMDPLIRSFKTAGTQPTSPGNPHQIQNYAIQSVTQNQIELIVPSGYSVELSALKGGQLLINSKYYLIEANTASVSGVTMLTVNPATMIADSVTTSNTARIIAAPTQSVTIEFYCESSSSIDWGGFQLEPSKFRTSMIYQGENIQCRSGSLLSFRRSPIRGLKTFGIWCSLNHCVGDGLIFDMKNLRLELVEGRLKLTIDAVVVALTEVLSADRNEIFIQILESQSSASIYVNGVLKSRATIAGFRGDRNGSLEMTSEGIRVWDEFIVIDTPLLEGQIAIGESAKGDVLKIFKAESLVSAELISRPAPLIVMPSIEIPAKAEPTAKTRITTINNATGVMIVGNATGFVIGGSVTVFRNGNVVKESTITNIVGNTITIRDINAGIVEDDTIAYGVSKFPAYASARFPADPIDSQKILSITPSAGTTGKIGVSSALSFFLGRAIVRTSTNQDVAEQLITNIDLVQNLITLDSISGVSIGCVIFQPANELIIDPDNYQVLSIDQITGVAPAKVGSKYRNGVRFENYNPYSVTITPAVRVYL
jgi:hypothetical protein